jgi:predicted dehydrogenase
MSTDLRLGLVGCGQVAARGYLPALRRVHGFQLSAVADSVLSRCRDVAPTVPAYPDAQSMIAAGGIDAIVLATPAATHLRDARRATAAGLPTLVEKPPALNAGDAAALATLDPSPWVGFNRRFDPLLRRLRARVPATGFLKLSLDLHYETGSWRPHVVDDDAVLSVGTHLIDLARWLTASDVRRVRARELSATRAAMELELDRATARLSCATDRPHRDWIEVGDSHGRVVARHDGASVASKAAVLWTLFHDRHSRRLIHPTSRTALVRLLIGELEAFAVAACAQRSLMAGNELSSLATAADGLAVMAVVDGARRSARENGAWQTLDAPADKRRAAIAAVERR